MVNFEYVNVKELRSVPQLLTDSYDEAVVIAGGTDLLDQLKERLIRPKRLVNLKGISGLKYIENGSGLRIGALTTIAEIASNSKIRDRYKVLADAARSVATPQLRNMGTLGGNLCQRPRCWYFRGSEFPCLKKGGARCYAATGRNKYHAIFGGGPSYIVHPSDTAPALMALGAKVTILGPDGSREVLLEDFFQLPGENLRRENILKPNEIITEVSVPQPKPGTRSIYLKFREKDSFDFAMSSVAAVLVMDGDMVREASVVLGGVAPIPWRSREAEKALEGKRITEDVAAAAAEAALAKAQPMRENAYKVPLTKALLRQAVTAVGSV
jgi:xanthine dehydrogenase YagS FAD-binding subunit